MVTTGGRPGARGPTGEGRRPPSGGGRPRFHLHPAATRSRCGTDRIDGPWARPEREAPHGCGQGPDPARCPGRNRLHRGRRCGPTIKSFAATCSTGYKCRMVRSAIGQCKLFTGCECPPGDVVPRTIKSFSPQHPTAAAAEVNQAARWRTAKDGHRVVNFHASGSFLVIRVLWVGSLGRERVAGSLSCG